jgi:hypothetical protein
MLVTATIISTSPITSVYFREFYLGFPIGVLLVPYAFPHMICMQIRGPAPLSATLATIPISGNTSATMRCHDQGRAGQIPILLKDTKVCCNDVCAF